MQSPTTRKPSNSILNITLNGLLEEQWSHAIGQGTLRCGRRYGTHLDEFIPKERVGQSTNTQPHLPGPGISPWAEVTRALFTRTGRKEFEFIRNGFKLKV